MKRGRSTNTNSDNRSTNSGFGLHEFNRRGALHITENDRRRLSVAAECNAERAIMDTGEGDWTRSVFAERDYQKGVARMAELDALIAAEDAVKAEQIRLGVRRIGRPRAKYTPRKKQRLETRAEVMFERNLAARQKRARAAQGWQTRRALADKVAA